MVENGRSFYGEGIGRVLPLKVDGIELVPQLKKLGGDGGEIVSWCRPSDEPFFQTVQGSSAILTVNPNGKKMMPGRLCLCRPKRSVPRGCFSVTRVDAQTEVCGFVGLWLLKGRRPAPYFKKLDEGVITCAGDFASRVPGIVPIEVNGGMGAVLFPVPSEDQQGEIEEIERVISEFSTTVLVF